MSAVETCQLCIHYVDIVEELDDLGSFHVSFDDPYNQISAMFTLGTLFRSNGSSTHDGGVHRAFVKMSGLPYDRDGSSDPTQEVYKEQWVGKSRSNGIKSSIYLCGTNIRSSVKFEVNSDPHIILNFKLETGPIDPRYGKDVCRQIYDKLARFKYPLN